MHGEGDLLLCLLIDLPPRNVPVNQLCLFAVTLVDLLGLFFKGFCKPLAEQLCDALLPVLS